MEARETTARRGRPPLLDAEQVLGTALAILEAEGLAAVTLRRLSAEFGVSHMTVYGYFDSKDSLLDALVAHTIAVPSIRQTPSGPWDKHLLLAMEQIHHRLVSRPGIAEVLISREFTGGWVAQVREQLLDLLRDAGFDDRQATDGISVLFNYLLGAVMIDVRRPRGGSTSAFDVGLRYLVSGLRSDPP